MYIQIQFLTIIIYYDNKLIKKNKKLQLKNKQKINKMQYKYIFSLILIILTINLKFAHECVHSQQMNKLKNKGIGKGIVYEENSELYKKVQDQKQYIQNEMKRRNLKNISSENVRPQPTNMRVKIDFQLNNPMDSQVEQAIRDAVQISAQYIHDVFNVFPLADNLRVQDTNGHENGHEGYCHVMQPDQLYTISEEQTITGMPDTDLLLYVTAVAAPEDQWFLAYAIPCQWVNDRVTVGVVNYNINAFLEYFLIQNENSFEELVETTIHEIMHVLGFGSDTMMYFRSQQRKRQSQEVFKSLVLQENIRGLDTLILATKRVKKAVQDYYGCATATGAQLENQGGEGSLGSHWERTMLFNETMNPGGIQSDAVTTIFTLSYFQDSNWYAYVDMSYAETIHWGKDRGCDFLGDCTSDFPEFFNTPDEPQCTFYHYGKGFAADTSEVGGQEDGCLLSQFYPNTGCTDPLNTEINPNTGDTFESYNYNSKCFESNIVSASYSGDDILPLRCYEQKCNDNGLEITISKDGTDYTILCGWEEGGQPKTIDGASGLTGGINCPAIITDFCEYPVACKDYCNRKGYCLQQKGQHTCHCLDFYAGEECQITCSGYISSADGSCVQSCEENEYYNKGNRVCKTCHSDCTNCNGPKNTDCTECPLDKYLNPVSQTCVSVCPLGSFHDKPSRKCLACNQKCINGCMGEADHCIYLPYVYENEDHIQYELSKNPYGDTDDFKEQYPDIDVYVQPEDIPEKAVNNSIIQKISFISVYILIILII